MLNANLPILVFIPAPMESKLKFTSRLDAYWVGVCHPAFNSRSLFGCGSKSIPCHPVLDAEVVCEESEVNRQGYNESTVHRRVSFPGPDAACGVATPSAQQSTAVHIPARMSARFKNKTRIR